MHLLTGWSLMFISWLGLCMLCLTSWVGRGSFIEFLYKSTGRGILIDSYQELPLLRVIPLAARTPHLLNIDGLLTLLAHLALLDFVGLAPGRC